MIYGIHGLKRSGKDTFGELLEKAIYATDTKVVKTDSFAAPLRNFAYDTMGVSEDNRHLGIPYLNYFYKRPMTGRELLQKIGTEVCRNIDKDFWLYALANRVGLQHNPITNQWETGVNTGWDDLIITDVRFENEAKFIKELGGKVIFIHRPSTGVQEIDPHVSEAGLSMALCDYCVSNSGDLSFLSEQATRLVNFKFRSNP